MRFFKMAAFLLVILFSTGCGTLVTKGAGQWGEEYSGARCSILVGNDFMKESHPAARVIGLPFYIDAVVSAAIDTVLLPFDLFQSPARPKGQGCYKGVHF
ncbi:MAG: hypothetical protein M0D55_16000 [Elusimicrobiota bacterium]|nr:MAG: hypothetical protein M0D55_16000 [Elusimicrobiota bacterium]